MIPNSRDHRIPVIYRITHRESGRIYVGSAVSFYSRYQVYKSCARPEAKPRRYIEAAIHKHGIKAFEFDILECVSDVATILDRENHWITTLRSADPEVGYNMCPAAGSWIGKKHRPEVRAKLSEIASTPANRARLSKHPAIVAGRLRGAQTIREQRSKPVYQIDMKTLEPVQLWPSATEAARVLSHRGSTINRAARGQAISAYGSYWRFKVDYDREGFIPRRRVRDHRNLRRPVRQLDLAGNVVKTWSSIPDLVKATPYSQACISDACRGRQNTAYGFRWQYVDDSEAGAYRKPKRMGFRSDYHLRLKPIQQLTPSGEIVRIWQSGSQIEKNHALISPNPALLVSIHECLKGAKDLAYGFRWQYVTDPLAVDRIREEARVEHAKLYGKL